MNRKKFGGFSPVFSYTLKRNLTSRKFLVSTSVIGLLLMLCIAGIFLLTGKPSNEKEGLQIKKIQICDETGIGIPDYKSMAGARGEADMEGLDFEEVKDADAAIKEGKEEKDYLLAVQTETEEGYKINLISGNDQQFEDSDLEYIGKQLSSDFQTYVYQQSGLSEEKLSQVLTPVVHEVVDFDEEGQERELLIYGVVYAVMFIIYLMVIFYGQQICAEVSQEKVTKLVEQLLVSVTPYSLVSGKILAVILTSIIQFLTWVVCVFVGIIGGDFLCGQVYEGYVSSITFVLEFVKSVLSGYSLEPVAVVVAICLIIFGLVFYLTMAGMAGSMITKPEEASNMQGIFMIPVLASFFLSLSLISSGAAEISLIWYLLPFTGAMLTPGAVLVGTVSLPVGIVCLAVSVLCSVFLLWIAAKIYKALMFYSGEKLKLGKVFKLVRQTK